MKVEPIKTIALENLRHNEGQLDWLPRNPRTWTQTDIDRTKRSIEEDAELMQARPLIAVPGVEKGTFIVFGGNLRLTAANAAGWPGAPVAVFHPDNSEIDREAIRRMALKDNGSFGSWDTDVLANEWNAEPWQLEEWGVPEWITGGAGKGSEPASNSRAAGEHDVKQPDYFSVRVDLPDAEAQLAFLEEMQQRGLPATVA